MREEKKVITGDDGTQVSGIYNQASAEPAQHLVVMVHGLTSDPNDYLLKMGQRFWNERGWDTLRIDLYDQRPLLESTLATHQIDTQIVLDYFAEKYKNLFVLGHSYGGLTLKLLAPQNVLAQSLWDPTSITLNWQQEMNQFAELSHYYFDAGVIALIGEPMAQERFALEKNANEQPFGVKQMVPTQIILAGDTGTKFPDNLVGNNQFYEALNIPKESYTIDTDHCFNRLNTVDELLEKTHAWFVKHAR